MLKQRIVRILLGLSLLAAVAGSSGIVADSAGVEMTPQTHACAPSGSGGC